MSKYHKFGSWSISILHYSLYYWDRREVVFKRVIRVHKDLLAHYYTYTSDYKRMHKIWWTRIDKDPYYIKRYGQNHEKNFRNLNKFLNNNLADIKNINRAKLLKSFNKYWNLLFLAEPIGDINHAIDEIYLERISKKFKDILKKQRKEEQFTNKLIAVTTPWEFLETQKEELNFLEIVSKFKGGLIDDIKPIFKKHLKKFEWIPVWYDNEPWEMEDLMFRLNQELKAKDIKKRMSDIKKYSNKTKLLNKKTIKELSLSGRLLKDINMLRYFTLIRTRVDLHTSYIVHKAKPIYERIAEEFKVTFSELKFLTPQEIRKGLVGKISNSNFKKIIKERQSFAVQVINLDKQKIITGKQAKNLHSKINQECLKDKPKVSLGNKKELCGLGASPGKAKGKARVISSISELSKMKDGEVLVVPSTSVDFVTAMKKSVAVVTEVGGITCHAAIVSRELGKPCVVNTLVATKVFKDGDLVEVDAERGIVRKI